MENGLYLCLFDHRFRVHGEGCPQILAKLQRDFFLYGSEYKSEGENSDEVSELWLKQESGVTCDDQGHEGLQKIKVDEETTVLRCLKTKSASLYCASSERLHEITYLYILSVVGKKMDLQGVHRIHASAVSMGEKASLFIGASGVGKSHIAYLLSGETLSDDTSYVCGKTLTMKPLLTRRGFAPTCQQDIVQNNKDNIYHLERKRYGQKILLPIKTAPAQKSYAIGSIYLLRPADRSQVLRATWWHKLSYFFRYQFIGLGTPQMVRFFWEPGWAGFWPKIVIAMKRLRLLTKLLAHRDTYVLETSRDGGTISVLSSDRGHLALGDDHYFQ